MRGNPERWALNRQAGHLRLACNFPFVMGLSGC
jgi:hypothetical protein